MLESLLEGFLKQEKVEAEEVFESCRHVNSTDPACLMCLDWIIATTEY